MPVVFFIDPGLPREVKDITLSYTFFEIEGAVAARKDNGPGAG
jgi:cytochrome c oxidase assembly protein subunit 11